MIYFTADNHFGHENIIRLCNRPWKTAEEMDEAMIALWNERVRNNDTVFILGDLCFRATNAENTLSRLKGKKRLLVGNHDGSWMKKVDLGKHFESVDYLLETSDGQHGLTLCHYPLLSWNHSKRAYMIYGHIHTDTALDFWPLIRVRDRMLNAGADLNGYRPVTFEELVVNNERFKAEHP